MDSKTATAPDDLPSTSAERTRVAWRVTLVGSVLDTALGVAKILVGSLSGSQALIADGIHSFSDLATDVGVLWVTRLSHPEPDTEHPYGHARFETLGTLALGAVLMVVAGGIAQDSLLRLLDQDFRTPGALALMVAAASVVGKEWVFRYTRNAAERIDSSLLLANAWHSRSDAFSSIAVMIGVGGAMAGWPWLDLLAAVVVAVMIGWIGWGLIAGAARELVDTGLSSTQLSELRLATQQVPGVVGVHGLRSRRMGSGVLLDMDIEVPSAVSVTEGHQIAWKVSERLLRDFPEVSDVKVHVDPDSRASHATLPLRGSAESALLACWRPLLEESIERLTLHYRGDGVDVELFLGGAADATRDAELATTLARAARDLPWFAGVRLWRSARNAAVSPERPASDAGDGR